MSFNDALNPIYCLPAIQVDLVHGLELILRVPLPQPQEKWYMRTIFTGQQSPHFFICGFVWHPDGIKSRPTKSYLLECCHEFSIPVWRFFPQAFALFKLIRARPCTLQVTWLRIMVLPTYLCQSLMIFPTWWFYFSAGGHKIAGYVL